MSLTTDINLLLIAPPLVLLITAAICLLFALTTSSSRTVALVALAGVGLALLTTLNLLGSASSDLSSFGGRYSGDTFSLGFSLVILLGTALAMLLAYDYLERHGLDYPEYYPLILLSATGAIVLASANDMIVLLLGLEIMSLAVYVLAAWRQNARPSEEAGMKYFLLGAFASAFLIYGIALLYGATGAFRFVDISLGLATTSQPLLALLAALLIVVGLGFKVALVPFHQWAPDVYTGAPTSVTAFMSVVVKTAAFAAFLKFASLSLPHLPMLASVLALLVALTMIIGNFGALAQQSVKRMLAYSAVAHAGYLGMALLAVGQSDANANQAILWYLLAYTLMNVGAFAVLTLLMDSKDEGDSLEHLAGLATVRPRLAAAMALFMLSLAGIPPLAGFAGKFLVFQAAIQGGYIWLAVLGIITSVVALVYYIRVIQVMYLRDKVHDMPRVSSSATTLAIAIAVIGTLLLGLVPNIWYQLF